MKKRYKIFIVLTAFFIMFSVDVRLFNETTRDITSLKLYNGIVKAEAKIEGDWCKSGKKNADEYWQFNWQSGYYVCTCVSEEDDCCVC